MKKYFILIVILIVLSLNCFKTTTPDIKENNIINKQVFLINKITTYSQDTSLKVLQINKYNSYGQCVKKLYINSEDKLFKKELIEYKDKSIVSITFNAKNKVLEIENKFYNQNGMLLKLIKYDTQKVETMRYEYEYKNNLITKESLFYSNKIDIKKFYHYKNSILSKIEYKNRSGTLVQIEQYSYNDQKQISKVELIDNKKKPIQNTNYQYDKNQNMLSKTVSINNTDIYSYLFEYDLRNNNTKLIYKDNSDTIIELKIFEYIKLKP